MLQKICENHTLLAEKDIGLLEKIAFALPYIAELLKINLFILCLHRDKQKAIVVKGSKGFASKQEANNIAEGQEIILSKECILYKILTEEIAIQEQDNIFAEVAEMNLRILAIKNRDGELIAALAGQCLQNPSCDLELHEMHHSMKNHLQMLAGLLSVQARSLRDKVGKEMLQEDANRILSIAAIHNLLIASETEKKINIVVLCQQLWSNLSQLHENAEHIIFAITGSPLFLPEMQATNTALVLNELLTNILKHSFPVAQSGKVYIDLQREAQFARITVQDDGVGLQKQNLKNGQHGLQLVKRIVEQRLQGQLQLISEGKGLQVILEFPIECFSK